MRVQAERGLPGAGGCGGGPLQASGRPGASHTKSKIQIQNLDFELLASELEEDTFPSSCLVCVLPYGSQ